MASAVDMITDEARSCERMSPSSISLAWIRKAPPAAAYSTAAVTPAPRTRAFGLPRRLPTRSRKGRTSGVLAAKIMAPRQSITLQTVRSSTSAGTGVSRDATTADARACASDGWAARPRPAATVRPVAAPATKARRVVLPLSLRMVIPRPSSA